MSAIDDKILRRGEAGYEQARIDSVWNGRIAERFPEGIVQIDSVDDIVASLELARRSGMKVGIRSGGHSWAGSHLRDGGLLLDLSRLNELSIDAERKVAVVGPGVRGSDLIGDLRDRGLFFPVGHCQGVALGGYLLQGGFGWLSRIYGPACESVVGVDLVTADGELLHANEQQNSDLFWAARGAGPGFFGVVTRFHLRLHEWPEAAMNSIYLYPIDVIGEVFTWADEIGPSVDRSVEMMIFLQRPETIPGHERVIGVTGPVLSASENEAREALSILETCPVRDQAIIANPNMATNLSDMVATSQLLFPTGNRFAVDNMWTSAPVRDLLPGLRKIADTLPPEPSHCMWMNWGPSPERPDMAYSIEDDTYIALYTSWTDSADDDRFVRWPEQRMREMESLASGIQLADENLGQRPALFISEDKLRRIEEIRASRDPEGLFHSWMATS